MAEVACRAILRVGAGSSDKSGTSQTGEITEPLARQGRPPAGRLGRKPSWADAQRPASEGPKYDAADDWIAENATPSSVVITADILLAERCLKAGATVLRHDGKSFDAASIGSAIATRAILEDLRAGMDGPLGAAGGGPPPFGKADRSNFLQALDRVLVVMERS